MCSPTWSFLLNFEFSQILYLDTYLDLLCPPLSTFPFSSHDPLSPLTNCDAATKNFLSLKPVTSFPLEGLCTCLWSTWNSLLPHHPPGPDLHVASSFSVLAKKKSPWGLLWVKFPSHSFHYRALNVSFIALITDYNSLLIYLLICLHRWTLSSLKSGTIPSSMFYLYNLNNCLSWYQIFLISLNKYFNTKKIMTSSWAWCSIR